LAQVGHVALIVITQFPLRAAKKLKTLKNNKFIIRIKLAGCSEIFVVVRV
jgi:hypothetical protein